MTDKITNSVTVLFGRGKTELNVAHKIYGYSTYGNLIEVQLPYDMHVTEMSSMSERLSTDAHTDWLKHIYLLAEKVDELLIDIVVPVNLLAGYFPARHCILKPAELEKYTELDLFKADMHQWFVEVCHSHWVPAMNKVVVNSIRICKASDVSLGKTFSGLYHKIKIMDFSKEQTETDEPFYVWDLNIQKIVDTFHMDFGVDFEKLPKIPLSLNQQVLGLMADLDNKHNWLDKLLDEIKRSNTRLFSLHIPELIGLGITQTSDAPLCIWINARMSRRSDFPRYLEFRLILSPFSLNNSQQPSEIEGKNPLHSTPLKESEYFAKAPQAEDTIMSTTTNTATSKTKFIAAAVLDLPCYDADFAKFNELVVTSNFNKEKYQNEIKDRITTLVMRLGPALEVVRAHFINLKVWDTKNHVVLVPNTPDGVFRNALKDTFSHFGFKFEVMPITQQDFINIAGELDDNATINYCPFSHILSVLHPTLFNAFYMVTSGHHGLPNMNPMHVPFPNPSPFPTPVFGPNTGGFPVPPNPTFKGKKDY